MAESGQSGDRGGSESQNSTSGVVSPHEARVLAVSPIIVTGMPRSGLAIVARLLRACGIWGEATPRGQMDESDPVQIRSGIARPFFRGMSASMTGTGGWLDADKCMAVSPDLAPIWRRRIHAAIRAQGYDGGRWMYRGPDACMAWPIWHEAFPLAKWIIVRRTDADIVTACKRMFFANPPEDGGGWDGWLCRYHERLKELRDTVGWWREIWPSKMISGELGVARCLMNDLEIPWDGTAIHDALTPVLWACGVFDAKEKV